MTTNVTVKVDIEIMQCGLGYATAFFKVHVHAQLTGLPDFCKAWGWPAISLSIYVAV